MNIDSTQPIRTEGIPAIGAETRRMLPTKGQAGEQQLQTEVNKPSAGNVTSQPSESALRELGQAAERFNVTLKFTQDEETGTIVVQMIDKTSGETLQQFPNASSLHVAAMLTKLQGKIFNVHA